MPLLALEVHRVHHAVDDGLVGAERRPSDGASRRPAWSCRGRRGRRSRHCAGPSASRRARQDWNEGVSVMGAAVSHIDRGSAAGESAVGVPPLLRSLGDRRRHHPVLHGRRRAAPTPPGRRGSVGSPTWPGPAAHSRSWSSAPDPMASVAAALAGSEATLASPAPAETGPVGQMLRGIELAGAEVHDLTAVLLWPARRWRGWVRRPITSLIETHGMARATLLRPTWHDELGWPVLVPLAHLDALARIVRRSAASRDRRPACSEHPHASRRSRRSGRHARCRHPVEALPAYEGPTRPAGRSHPRVGHRCRSRGGSDDDRALGRRALAHRHRATANVIAHAPGHARREGEARHDEHDTRELTGRGRLTEQHDREEHGDDGLGQQDRG